MYWVAPETGSQASLADVEVISSVRRLEGVVVSLVVALPTGAVGAGTSFEQDAKRKRMGTTRRRSMGILPCEVSGR